MKNENIDFILKRIKEMGIEVTINKNPSEEKIEQIKNSIKKREEYMKHLKHEK